MFEARKIRQFYTLLTIPCGSEQAEQVIRTFRIPVELNKHEAYHKTLKKIEEGKRRRIGHEALLLSPVYRIAISTAASLILIFLLQLLLFAQTSIQSGDHSQSLRLPDHSRVVLSANSSVSYSSYFWNRKLKLQGEAYFEVKRGEKFIVRTDEGSVSVLGTRFMVSQKNNQLDVSCYEGQVAYENKQLHAFIPAGTSKVFSENQTLSIQPLTQSYPQEASFRANYSDENLQQVLQQLEDFFQVDIQLQSDKVYSFTGTLETASFESALKIICRSLNLHYSFSKSETVLLTEK